MKKKKIFLTKKILAKVLINHCDIKALMKNKSLSIIFIAVLLTSIISCTDKNNNAKAGNDGIVWKQSITLTGGNYGTSGITHGGDSASGTWNIDGDSVTLTCPTGYAMPTDGTAPAVGEMRGSAISIDKELMRNAIGPGLQVSISTGTRYDASGSWPYSANDFLGVVNAYYNMDAYVTWADCIATADQKHYEGVHLS